ALGVLENLERASALDAGDYSMAFELAAGGGPKVTATRAIRLADRVLARDPAAFPKAVPGLKAALWHSSVDVQRLAVDVVSRRMPPGDVYARSALVESMETVAPSVRSRLEDLVGVSALGVVASNALTDGDDVADLLARARALPPSLQTAVGIDAA